MHDRQPIGMRAMLMKGMYAAITPSGPSSDMPLMTQVSLRTEVNGSQLARQKPTYENIT